MNCLLIEVAFGPIAFCFHDSPSSGLSPSSRALSSSSSAFPPSSSTSCLCPLLLHIFLLRLLHLEFSEVIMIISLLPWQSLTSKFCSGGKFELPPDAMKGVDGYSNLKKNPQWSTKPWEKLSTEYRACRKPSTKNKTWRRTLEYTLRVYTLKKNP